MEIRAISKDFQFYDKLDFVAVLHALVALSRKALFQTVDPHPEIPAKTAS
tara:strand:+ start:269 stop:418 length:150 start_codon:yes stop_codon:yes gene_type:complete